MENIERNWSIVRPRDGSSKYQKVNIEQLPYDIHLSIFNALQVEDAVSLAITCWVMWDALPAAMETVLFPLAAHHRIICVGNYVLNDLRKSLPKFWKQKVCIRGFVSLKTGTKTMVYFQHVSGVLITRYRCTSGRCDDNAGEGTRGEIKTHEPGTDRMFVDRDAHCVIMLNERDKNGDGVELVHCGTQGFGVGRSSFRVNSIIPSPDVRRARPGLVCHTMRLVEQSLAQQIGN
ncbi:hypothetical protein BU17DRAFT_67823 [Hysterangium stoloniferum]|nr:hypothetical protein BU17DRAFT_67823 [Hysterangium stoloniferum]